MKHTYKAKTFINPRYESIEGLMAGRVQPVITTGDGAYWHGEGYVHVGEATVTVDLFSEKEIHAKQLDGLNTQLAVVRAENQRRENAILDQISKLQALTYSEAA